MKAYLLIGTLLVMSLVASCAAEPEEGVPTTAADDVASEPVETAGPAGSETEPVNPAYGSREVLEADASTSTSSIPVATRDDAPVAEAENRESAEPTAPPPEPEGPLAEASEPAEPEASASELPEPGGPWIDPRQPDLTKTVPPPQR
jgi:hypothetical protein